MELSWPVVDAGARLELSGRLAVREGVLEHPALAPRRVEGMGGKASFRLLYEPAPRHQLLVTVDELELLGLRGGATLRVDRLGRAPLAARFSLELPRQPCQGLAEALPSGLAPDLAGMRLAGEMQGKLQAALDLRNRDEPLESLRLRGWPGLRRCRIETLGPAVEVEPLAGKRYVHIVTPPRTDLPVQKVGPGTRSYVPLEEIPTHVLRSMLVTENSSFYKGGPVSLGLIRKALNIDLKQGRYVYGGSTISQQLVKNLFLTPEKTLSRTVVEAFIAWRMEQVLTKDRILELYVNCIEFAPGIYGIERAAHYYFDHGAAELTPVEGAFLATIKPLPADGPRMARNGKVDGWWHKRVVEVVEILEKEGEITPEERAGAEPWQPSFRPDFVEHSRKVLRRLRRSRRR